MGLSLPDKYFVLDFETNGLPKKDDTSNVDITEIGWIECDGSSINKEGHVLCKPVDKDGKQIPLSKKIVEITHITDDMLKDKEAPTPAFKGCCEAVVFSELPVVGHNIIGFDRLFLDKYCQALGWPCIDNSRYIDTAALFKAYRKAHRNKDHKAVLPQQKQLFSWSSQMLKRSWSEDQVKFNLTAAVGYLAIPQFGIKYERHRAIYDCVLTQRVLEKLKEVL